MCGINAVGAQGCGRMFTFWYAHLKMGVLLHKMPKGAVYFGHIEIFFKNQSYFRFKTRLLFPLSQQSTKF